MAVSRQRASSAPSSGATEGYQGDTDAVIVPDVADSQPSGISQEIMQDGSRPPRREPLEAERQQAMNDVEVGALVFVHEAEKSIWIVLGEPLNRLFKSLLEEVGFICSSGKDQTGVTSVGVAKRCVLLPKTLEYVDEPWPDLFYELLRMLVEQILPTLDQIVPRKNRS